MRVRFLGVAEALLRGELSRRGTDWEIIYDKCIVEHELLQSYCKKCVYKSLLKLNTTRINGQVHHIMYSVVVKVA